VARAVGSSEAPVDIIGWSLGGLVAQELCCVAPSEVRRAVLASTSPGGDDFDKELISRDFFDVFDGWADDDTRKGEAARRRAAAAAFVHASPERWVERHVDALKADVDAFVGVRRAAAAIRGQKACALAPFPDCSRLPEKRYLVLHGDVDPVVDAALAARLAERAPGAKLLLLAGVGHRAWAQEPDEWCARVLDFLDAA
jgi:pimeloyl-ACP methyl ester carboxylesterase